MERKWKSLLFVSFCLLLLSACNLPGRDPSPIWTPTLVDLIEVVVAQTLTAMPTEEAVIEVLTPVPTETPAPLPTETLVPTEEPTPTDTPAPTATMTASPAPAGDIITGEPGAHFLHIYFDAVIRGDYASAWNNLTLAYRQNMHDNLLSDFVEGYEDMNLCDIEISDIRVVTYTGSYAKLAAHFIYKIGESCTGYPYDFYAHYNFDAVQNRWLLDGLTKQ